MRTKKRRVRWLVGITGTLLVLLLAVILLAPRFVNLERVRERILTTISQKVGGHVEYQKLDLSLFPRPRVAIHQASLSIPGKTSGSLGSMEAYPKILPLFRGKLRLAKVRVEAPDFTIKLPERSAEKKKGQRPAPIVNIRDTVAGLFATLSSDAPDLVVVVKKGRVNLSQENQLGLSFEDIDARFVLPPSGFRIDVSCSSSLWERMSVKGALDHRDLKGTAEIDLAHFRPHTLMSILLPKMNQRLLDSQVNVHLSLVTDGLTNLQAKVDGSIPFLAFQQGDEKLVVKGKGMEATVDMSENRTMVLLTTLDLDNPQLSISGKFQMDQVSPPIRVEMEGRDVDVASTREVALALAGKVPVIQEICDFFRGGRVPLVTLSSQGRSMADLDNMENIVVTGSIAEGKIVVPAAKVDLGGRTVVLEDVRGEGTVAQGILEGKNLRHDWVTREHVKGD